jgi:hypothetical protein
MTDEKKALTLEFAPGCFDNFDGTQEELDEMIADINRMFESGELEANATAVDIESLMEEDPDLADVLFARIEKDEKRNLQ